MLRAGAILCGNFSLGTREYGPPGAQKGLLGVVAATCGEQAVTGLQAHRTSRHDAVRRRGRQGRLSVRVVGVAEVAEHRHARLVAPGKQLDCSRMSAARMTPLR